jgi:glutaredoxin-like YruB-family protein
MDNIQSLKGLHDVLGNHPRYFLLIHRGTSEVSQCALQHLEEAVDGLKIEVGIGQADVNSVTDVHGEYNVDSAPTLLVFENQKLNNVIKGCMDKSYYRALVQDELTFRPAKNQVGKKAKNVIVYTTPSCSWCTKIKQHLNAHAIPFREIDVASDPAKAEEMKRKSGQMGVPQTEINGQMIVGFDRPKIDRLLEIA